MSKITRFQPYIFILLAAGFLYYWPQGFLYYWCQGFYISDQTIFIFQVPGFLYLMAYNFYISDQTIFIFGPKHFLTINKRRKENEKEKR